jgi:hypothetical protein
VEGKKGKEGKGKRGEMKEVTELTDDEAIASATKLRSMCARSRCYTVGDIKEFLDSLAETNGEAQRKRYDSHAGVHSLILVVPTDQPHKRRQGDKYWKLKWQDAIPQRLPAERLCGAV